MSSDEKHRNKQSNPTNTQRERITHEVWFAINSRGPKPVVGRSSTPLAVIGDRDSTVASTER